MMVRNGGQERTDAEYAALLAQSGFGLRRTLPLQSVMGLHIIEAVAV